MPGTEPPSGDLGRQRLMLSKLRSLEADLTQVQHSLDSLEKRITDFEGRLLSQEAKIEEHDGRMKTLRLDRQLRQVPKWLARRFTKRD